MDVPGSHEKSSQRFTPIGAVLFGLSVILLLSKFVSLLTGASDLVTNLAHGFRQVNAFALAGNYIHEVNATLGRASPVGANLGTFIVALMVALPAAIGESLKGGFWPTVGVAMVIVFGLTMVWDSLRKNWAYIFAVPFAGGLVAWVLSSVILQVIFWLLLVSLHVLVLVGGVSAYAPRASEAAGDILEKFHLTKDITSDASRVFGRGQIAEKIERIEKSGKT
jgi:hypothetical protein